MPTTRDAIRHIVNMSGKTQRQLAADMGKAAPTYVSVMLNRGTDPKATTLSQLADACGYDLQLVRRDGGEVITIEGRGE